MKKLKETQACEYSEKYFLSEVGPGGAVYHQAFKYIPKDIDGPFLDIGSGRGEMAVCLARAGKKAYGIDYSPAAISLSQEILRAEKKSVQTKAYFQLADCTNLPFKNKTFQCLFLLDVVEHLTPKQLKLTLKEANRVLKRQGVLIIHTNNKYFEKMAKFFIAASYSGLKVFLRIRKTLRQAASRLYDYLHINYLTGTELCHYLEESGFNSKVEYVKPTKKGEIQKFIPYNERWKKYIFYNIAWFFLNTPLIKFMSPTFWIIARKR